MSGVSKSVLMPIWAFPVKWDDLHGAHTNPDTVRIINQWELGRALAGGFDAWVDAGLPVEEAEQDR